MDYPSSINQSSRKKTLYIVVIVAALVIIGVVAWYYFGPQALAPTPSALQQQNPAPALNTGNTTTDIANDLNQIPDDSAALKQDQNSLDQEIKGF